jgi:hypothetical protein
MKFLVAMYNEYNGDTPIPTYAHSMVRELRNRGHDVIVVPKSPLVVDNAYLTSDVLLDIDCGRNSKGQLEWHGAQTKPPIKSIVYLIDSHGHPTPHRRLAKNYDHVFFAVWDKRDLFEKHPSAHWCPNFTDTKWFDKGGVTYINVDPGTPVQQTDFGFFGTKGGHDRTKQMIEICIKNKWTVKVQEIAKNSRVRWPLTCLYMDSCDNLFNHAQKHDGPNLRVMESMAVGKPLICDSDPRSGMDKLFTPWKHYIPYNYDYSGLEDAMQFCMSSPEQAHAIAWAAYNEVTTKHLVGNRIDQMLGVLNAS